MDCHSLHTFQKKVLMDIIHITLTLTEDHDRGSSLLKALQQIHNLGLFLHILHLNKAMHTPPPPPQA